MIQNNNIITCFCISFQYSIKLCNKQQLRLLLWRFVHCLFELSNSSYRLSLKIILFKIHELKKWLSMFPTVNDVYLIPQLIQIFRVDLWTKLQRKLENLCDVKKLFYFGEWTENLIEKKVKWSRIRQHEVILQQKMRLLETCFFGLLI